MFIIWDEMHAERQGQFPTRQSAIEELRRRAEIEWDQAPNRAPCTNWRNCRRRYELAEYDDTTKPWKELSRNVVLVISAAGVVWHAEQSGREIQE